MSNRECRVETIQPAVSRSRVIPVCQFRFQIPDHFHSPGMPAGCFTGMTQVRISVFGGFRIFDGFSIFLPRPSIAFDHSTGHNKEGLQHEMTSKSSRNPRNAFFTLKSAFSSPIYDN